MTTIAATPGLTLRTALRADGWSTGVFGVVLLAAAPLLREPLGLPTAWSVPFGVAMLGGALALLLIAGYPEIPARAGQAVVAVNLASGIAMVVLAFTDLIPLTGLGVVFLLAGAAVVVAFGELEYVALRRATR
ncbi:hypothetical protein NDR87_15115 [Nocardia sp. CDC159]|uniref:Uncharacterized protein n=1 Tax=Nocardia pulmonis TaxID=2951408 RepID=A0A9X2E8A4_9NOCA|nr:MULTISPECIES: hypothetical protein [Nocardia]MCM6775579.1 hypothetical protein [Nocardia pulmonis]MCM6787687.1 hypothetical protein [Nocardia sp. CDC159]